MPRTLTIAVAQLGPQGEDKGRNLSDIDDVLGALAPARPDFVLLPELSATCFFPVGLGDARFLELAEEVPGETTARIGERARDLDCYIIASIAERGAIAGEHYISAVLLGPDGSVVEGEYPDGTTTRSYRKNHVGQYNWPTGSNDEKFYFRPGRGYPTFPTRHGRVGILICYDRWFSESYRVLALQGAELLFNPNASSGFVSDVFARQLQTHAVENGVAIVGSNKGGDETIGDTTVRYYGRSAIVDPDGTLVAQGKDYEPDVVVGEVDMDKVAAVRNRVGFFRDRRPEIYGPITER